MLWAAGALSPDETLRRAARAEPYAPFRERFYYNNVMYLAAGWAGAAAGGKDWHTLISERILTPLGMTDTQTSIRAARGGPRVARGYAWDENLEILFLVKTWDDYRQHLDSTNKELVMTTFGNPRVEGRLTQL